MKLDHIGIVVSNLEWAVARHMKEKNCKPITSILRIENQGVNVQLLDNGTGVNIEIIEPLNENSPVVSFLKRGIGLAHICYAIHDFEEVYAQLRTKVVREPLPAPQEYFNGGRTFFMHNGFYLVEYLEIVS